MRRLGHLELEIIATARRGRPLGPDEPAPGCGCPTCLTLQAGGTREDAHETRMAVEVLAGIHPEDRMEEAASIVEACAARGVVLPSPGVLTLLADDVPGALREGWRVEGCPCERCQRPPSREQRDSEERRRQWREAVQRAREVPILDIAARLGLGEPVQRGREVSVRCPFHEDHRPSLQTDPDAGVWYCFVCGIGGDALDLYRQATGLGFREVVEDLTGGRVAA